MTFQSPRFEDTPFGDYDTTPGTERFPDGWYDGTVVEVRNAGELEEKKQVKIVVQLDDMPLVQRKLGIAWGSKDGEPAAWVKFISNALSKAHGDETLRVATPKTVRGKRLACHMRWSTRGYMDIVDFGPVGYTGQGSPTGPQPGVRPSRNAPPARNGATSAPRDERPAPSRATAGRANLHAVPTPGSLTPGQMRCLKIGDDLNADAQNVRAFIREQFNCELEDVQDSEVGQITAGLRKAFAASA